MTTAKRVGLASATIAVLGVGVAAAVSARLWPGRGVTEGAASALILGGAVGVLVAVLMVFWRRVQGGVKGISRQLEDMTDAGEIGLVMIDGTHELARLAAPLNEFLSVTRTQLDELRADNRELQIESRLADAEKSHAEAIIFSISDAVIVTNRFDELILANQAAEELLGFALETALRKNVDRVVSDGTLVRLIRETRSHRRAVTRNVVEHTIDRRGVPRTFRVTLSCVATADNEVSGVVAVLHDVTREKEIARMKTDFVSNVSHELKTPLASIKAYIEMLVDGEARDERTRNEFYEIINGETDRLNRLIENILNISRIESGVVKVSREPISLTRVAREVLDVARPWAKVKHIEVVEDLAPACPQVQADRDMISQAVMNLVSNAVKYTPAGGTVTVRVHADAARGMAVCDVTDTGLGIPADDLPRIFDKFYRVRANKEAAKGTGLGLALVKHIVETAHDGRLTVTSEEGRGSTFSFELPVLA